MVEDAYSFSKKDGEYIDKQIKGLKKDNVPNNAAYMLGIMDATKMITEKKYVSFYVEEETTLKVVK